MADSSKTKNREDYLNEIYRLQILANGAIKGVHLSKALKVSRPSVSEMLKKLSKEKLIAYSGNKGITLTKKGIESARNINRKHQLLEVFFSELLKLKNRFHAEAHNMEHELSDEAADKLDDLLKNPKTCPDGNPIPKKSASVVELTFAKPDRPLRLLFSKVSEKHVIERLNSLGIIPNQPMILKKRIDSGPVILEVKGSEVAIGRDIAKKIFVEEE